MQHAFGLFAAAAIMCGGAISAHAASWTFQGLGIPGYAVRTYAQAVSADGSVVVGFYEAPFSLGHQAFRWSSGEGMISLPARYAYGISADGSVIVGYADAEYGGYRWTSDGGMTFIGQSANGVSADGSVVVGDGFVAEGGFRWSADGGVIGLGDLPGGRFESTPTAVSADGSIVVGSSHSALGTEAFRWTAAGGMIGLGDLPGGNFSSWANAISADGSAVVGGSSTGPGTVEAFWWTSGGMIGLGHLPGGFASEAMGVSADGSIVVGFEFRLGGGAFIWTRDKGMQDLREVLIAGGAADGLSGWNLSQATAISADGRTIIGNGTNPQGKAEAWIATLVVPEPSSFALLGVGALGLFSAIGRRRLTPVIR